MGEFTGEDLSGSRFLRVDLTDAEFRDADLSRAQFRGVAFHGVVMRGVELGDVRIDGEIKNLVINGVDVAPLVDAELDRRDPDRVKMRPTDPAGFRDAWDLVERLLTERINSAEIKNFYDFKTRLQETAQARLKATPTYRVVQELGPDHDKRFVVADTIGTDEWARAVGKSKKEAEQMAAAEAHFRLEGSDAGIRPKQR